MGNKTDSAVPGIPFSRDHYYDYLKHLTTLTSGTLVLLATFANRFENIGYEKYFLVLPIALFVTSLTCAVIGMLLLLGVENPINSDEDMVYIIPMFKSLKWAASTFLLGVSILGFLAAWAIFVS